MPLRKLAFVLFGALALPVAASAGPIEFGPGVGNLTSTNPNPGADAALVPIQPPGPPTYTFDPASGETVGVAVVGYDPSRLPAAPAWATTHPDGTIFWDVNGYYSVPLTIFDIPSGRSATFTFSGQAHMVADDSPATGAWTGSASFSSSDWTQVRLGGNLYSLWGTVVPTENVAAVYVWAGDGTPPIPHPQYTPEPGTFALAALGLVPLGAYRLRRGSRSDAAGRGV